MFTDTFTTEAPEPVDRQQSRALRSVVTGHGDPIVLMPGTLTGWAPWVAHAERLSANRRVIRLQLRNVELAEDGVPIPESYGIQTEVDGLRMAVDRLKLDRFDLVGWSYGGSISLTFAMNYPERVKSLTLIEPAAVWVLRDGGVADRALAEQEATDRALVGKDITIDDLKAFLVRAGIGKPGSDFESHPRWPIMVRNRQALSVTASIWDYQDSVTRLRQLDVRTLVVRGTESTENDRMIADKIVWNMPDASLLELPGDHSCHIQSMDRFLEALERHLER